MGNKMKLIDVVGAYNAFRSILDRHEYKLKITWPIETVLESLESHQKRYFDELKKIMIKYNIESENGTSFKQKDGDKEKLDQFLKDIEELMEIKVVANAKKIKIGIIDEVVVIGNETHLIKDFIEEDD